MKEIQLTQGKVALVDDADYEYLMQWKWFAHTRRGTGRWYAVRTDRTGEKQARIQMHQQLLGLVKGKEIDHKNGDGLDNQRENLRPCTFAQNQHNRIVQANNLSGYKGVGRHRCHWRARINVFGKSIHIGKFKQAIDAAIAYDEAAQIHHGEFARLNFSYDPACFI